MRQAPQSVESLMMGLHGEFERLFASHQVALLDRCAERALALLVSYRAAVVQHIADEEALILPLFAARGGESLNSPPRQFLGEHKKIRECLDELVHRCEHWQQSGSDKDLLELFDREAWFKNLMMHHDVREAKVLYPRFQDWASEIEKQDVLAQIQMRELNS